ncbi:hypothetical protein MTR67_031627, partial [Solanum verrucosum]
DPPSDFILPLLRYKKELLAWSLKQEESTFKGVFLLMKWEWGRLFKPLHLCLLSANQRSIPVYCCLHPETPNSKRNSCCMSCDWSNAMVSRD